MLGYVTPTLKSTSKTKINSSERKNDQKKTSKSILQISDNTKNIKDTERKQDPLILLDYKDYKTPIKMPHYSQSLLNNISTKLENNDNNSEEKIEQTEVKGRKDARLLQLKQNETEVKKISNSRECENTTKNNNLDKSNSEASQSFIKTGSQNGNSLTYSNNKLELDLEDLAKNKNLKRRSFVEKLYVPTKKIKRNQSFYKGSIQLYDKMLNEYLNFRVFKESDLGFNRIVQEKLRETKIDDDCPTDSEQMELACKHVQKQLRQGIDFQSSSSSSQPTSSPSLSDVILNQYSFCETFSSFGKTSSFELKNDDFTLSLLESQKDKRIAKKLSYRQLQSSLTSQEIKFPEEKLYSDF